MIIMIIELKIFSFAQAMQLLPCVASCPRMYCYSCQITSTEDFDHNHKESTKLIFYLLPKGYTQASALCFPLSNNDQTF